MSDIRVVNCKKKQLEKLGYLSLLDFLRANDKHLYVGRDMTYSVPGAVASKWQNPFRVQEHNGDANLVCEMYEQYVRNGPLWERLHELRAKTLACWCHPAPCHAHVLKSLFEERYPERHEVSQLFKKTKQGTILPTMSSATSSVTSPAN
jgi:hypothetical protein